MKYDWIFFDLDNTLMDFNNASKKAFSSAFLEHGLREAEGHYEVYREVNGSAWKDFESGKINATTLKKKRFDDFFLTVNIKGIEGRAFNALYLNYLIEHSFMLDGAIELLEQLKGKVQKAVITNGFKEVQRPRIKKLDLEKYFPVIVVSDEEDVSKPNAAYFDIVMNLCNNPSKEKILVVGDSLNSDIKGGINYGIDTCWCNLFGQVNTTQLSPTFEINHLNELPSLLY